MTEIVEKPQINQINDVKVKRKRGRPKRDPKLPKPVYNSPSKAKEYVHNYNHEYYKKNMEKIKKHNARKKHCDICNKSCNISYFTKHLKTLKHIENEKLLNKST